MSGWYKEQIGPLPAGAWVAVVGGGLGLAWYSRRHPGAPAPVTVAPSADLGPTHVIDDAGPLSSPTTPGTTPPITTNEDWIRVASSVLIAHGYDPLLVSNALADYMAGNSLDLKETAIIQEALRLVGPPPLSAPPPLALPPGPTTHPDPAPPAVITPPAPPPTIHSGSGFFTGPSDQLDFINRNNVPSTPYPVQVVGLDGFTYEWLSPTAETPVDMAGRDVYVQVAPRIFVDIGPWRNTGPLTRGTPIYLRIDA